MVYIVLVTVYVKKEEEKAYHAVMLDTLTTHDFKMEVPVHIVHTNITHVLIVGQQI